MKKPKPMTLQEMQDTDDRFNWGGGDFVVVDAPGKTPEEIAAMNAKLKGAQDGEEDPFKALTR